ncbi:MAG: XRE family transcriptional regulator [Firmicutes bacterium HGW-Firmicutes-1]|jgi:transcriptional regulator with XRE-family HTH domain|nr:MAG: XRE family transcriptional regulator [Firmicutes bacterium HGW-Firmicutes-1]
MLTFEQLGLKLKEHRESKDLSQKELASLLLEKGINLTRESISKIESGKRLVNAIELRVIAETLNTNTETLLGEEEEEINLVGLCRRNGDIEVTEEVEWALDDLWYFMTTIARQKKLYKGEIKIEKNEPSWV